MTQIANIPDAPEALEVRVGAGPPASSAIAERGVSAPSPDFLSQIPRDFARRHLLVSVGVEGGSSERLLVSDATDPCAAFNVGVRLGRRVHTELAPGERIARLIDEAYASAIGSAREGGAEPSDLSLALAPFAGADLDRLVADADRDLLSTSGKGEIVRLVDAILFEALGRGASDVHVQPLARATLVRYRVDGVLHTARELPARLMQPVVSRIKVMGRMDIAERRLAQDGRATVTIGPAITGSVGHPAARSIDLRISTFPTSYGERAVVRLLESRGTLAHASTLESLGMPGVVRTAYLDRADRSNGIVLVTGPTGSGKSTTLYATLRWLSQRWAGELNVMTIEDPIEYELSEGGVAISQGQVNSKKGITFATGLRHILRQDPDVIMVGEIRDAETARIAVQASLTGHLVFSTLHTNDSAGAVTRLADLGVEPYLISASLSAVLAQRLVRRLHAPCAGRGCEACFRSGLAGRIGLFELLVVDEPMRERVIRGAGAVELRRVARDAGMRTLEEEGRRLIDEGVTTQAEVTRVVQGMGEVV
jgi:general secretion pathway protein E